MADLPILDDHLHLDPINGRGVEAVRDFVDAGGSHLLVVNKPSWSLEVTVETAADFRGVFEPTLALVERATEVLPGRAWPVLGVHPALISRLVDRGVDPDDAAALMQSGLDIAAEYVAAGDALALKSGRPHYEVADPVWEHSNAVLRHALTLGAETGAAVQLHTEAGSDFEAIATWAEDRGLPRERVVKHYAAGPISGPIPSVIARTDELEAAVSSGDPFMMETDYLDDPDRPGAVLGPRTVPRRVRWLREADHVDAIRQAHVDTPARVYGIDAESTLE